MRKDYLELSELLAMVKEGVSDAFPDKYWVKGEISSWSPRANGHCYLNLSETVRGRQVADIRAMIWKWQFPQLKAFFEKETGQTLQAGLTVLVRVQVNFSELYGISLFVDDIDPAFTAGAQALEKKKAIERLTAGGYLDMQKELVLPPLPYRLAVITSKTAAGYGDFRRHLLENEAGYAFRLDLYEALMQGEQAPASIISALLEAQEEAYDAILILRGGGSEMDLSCFDDYDLAVAIATCPVPVVTAIGHDRDFHIADMVANRFVKTPTACSWTYMRRRMRCWMIWKHGCARPWPTGSAPCPGAATPWRDASASDSSGGCIRRSRQSRRVSPVSGWDLRRNTAPSCASPTVPPIGCSSPPAPGSARKYRPSP